MLDLKSIRKRAEKANNGTYNACKDGSGLSFEVRARKDIPALLGHIDKLTAAAMKAINNHDLQCEDFDGLLDKLHDVIKEANND